MPLFYNSIKFFEEEITMHSQTEQVYQQVLARDPGEREFQQAVYTFLLSIDKIIDELPEVTYHRVLERMVEPERVVMFRVPWVDDEGKCQVNRGFRVQMSSAIGPYKGGLRLHPSVNLSIMKFLAFEQVFKNSLTGLPMGGGKGGSDFNPKGKSDNEVMRFCQSFMTELCRHIGPDTDVPAGDIGVGAREIGYLFGQYKKIRNQFSGVLTGKGLEYGGSYIRPEATGYGLVYLSDAILRDKKMGFEGATCLVSGSGNVAQFTVEKINALGGKVITLSDSSGMIIDEAGIDKEKLAFVKMLKNVKRGRIKEYAEKYGVPYIERNPNEPNPLWNIKADYAFPCATQNEILKDDALNLVKVASFQQYLVARLYRIRADGQTADARRRRKHVHGKGGRSVRRDDAQLARQFGIGTGEQQVAGHGDYQACGRTVIAVERYRLVVDVHFHHAGEVFANGYNHNAGVHVGKGAVGQRGVGDAEVVDNGHAVTAILVVVAGGEKVARQQECQQHKGIINVFHNDVSF